MTTMTGDNDSDDDDNDSNDDVALKGWIELCGEPGSEDSDFDGSG